MSLSFSSFSGRIKEKRKTPIFLKNRLYKHLSLNNYNSKYESKKIYKVRDRLFSTKAFSILCNSSNFINYLQSKRQNRPSLDQMSGNIDYKSFNNNKECFSMSPIKGNRNKSMIEENNDKNFEKEKISLLFYSRDSNPKINKSLISPGHGPNNINSNLLVNHVLKYNISKKKENQKQLSPMKLGKEYRDYIERKNKLFFNPNYNTSYFHKKYSDYFIEANLSPKFKKQKLKLKPRKSEEIKNEKEESDLESESELKDKIEEMAIDTGSYKRAIKIFLSDETKLNKHNFHEPFFDVFENKVNFLFDFRKFPTIKNNLRKIKIKLKPTEIYEWKLLNVIEVSTLIYLNKLKAKIQRELDEIEEENKDKQFKINQQIGIYDEEIFYDFTRKKKTKDYNKEHNQKEDNENDKRDDHSHHHNFSKKEDNKTSQEEAEEEDEEDNGNMLNKKDIYDLEEYFIHKGLDNKEIKFASPKLSYYVYYNPKFYKTYYINKKNNENIYQKEKMKKYKYDFYL